MPLQKIAIHKLIRVAPRPCPSLNNFQKALKYKKLAEELNVKEVSVLVNYINKVSVDIEGLSGEIEKKQEIVGKKREKLYNNFASVFS